ncbi:Global transcription regulator sge1, variant 2 [Basidiobolus ranarum]
MRRRLHEKEKKLLRSGSVYVFDEKESGIKRWTDGRLWSPSRILGNFLVYRELDKKIAPRKPGSSRADEDAELLDVDKSSVLESNKGTFVFKHGGLIKKTIAIELNNTCQHLICYHTIEDVHAGRLNPPLAFMELAQIRLSSDLIKQHRFRKPVKGYTTSSESPDNSKFQSVEPVGECQSQSDAYDESSNWSLEVRTNQALNEPFEQYVPVSLLPSDTTFPNIFWKTQTGACAWDEGTSSSLNWPGQESLSLPQLHALFPNLQFNDHSEFTEIYSAQYPAQQDIYFEASSSEANSRKRKSR